MAYVQNNVQVSTNWKPEIASAFKTLAESEGWTTIENGYNDGTYTRWVFKANTNDFYVVMFCNTSRLNSNSASPPSDMGLFVCEDYNSTNKTFIKPAVMSLASDFAAAADHSLGTTEYTIASIISGPWACCIPNWTGSSVPAAPTTYAICVKADYCWIITTGAGINALAYFGTVDSMVYSANTNDPICIASLYGHTNGYSSTAQSSYTIVGSNRVSYIVIPPTTGMTRSALNGGKSAHKWGMRCAPYIDPDFFIMSDTNSSSRDLYSGANAPIQLSPAVLVRNAGYVLNPTDIHLYGYIRAASPRILFGGRSASSFDEITIGSDTYVCSSSAFFVNNSTAGSAWATYIDIWFLKG